MLLRDVELRLAAQGVAISRDGRFLYISVRRNPVLEAKRALETAQKTCRSGVVNLCGLLLHRTRGIIACARLRSPQVRPDCLVPLSCGSPHTLDLAPPPHDPPRGTGARSRPVVECVSVAGRLLRLLPLTVAELPDELMRAGTCLCCPPLCMLHQGRCRPWPAAASPGSRTASLGLRSSTSRRRAEPDAEARGAKADATRFRGALWSGFVVPLARQSAPALTCSRLHPPRTTLLHAGGEPVPRRPRALRGAASRHNAPSRLRCRCWRQGAPCRVLACDASQTCYVALPSRGCVVSGFTTHCPYSFAGGQLQPPYPSSAAGHGKRVHHCRCAQLESALLGFRCSCDS